MVASSEEIPYCSHFGRIDIGLRNHASPEQYSDFSRIELVVFGFAAMDGFHFVDVKVNSATKFVCF